MLIFFVILHALSRITVGALRHVVQAEGGGVGPSRAEFIHVAALGTVAPGRANDRFSGSVFRAVVARETLQARFSSCLMAEQSRTHAYQFLSTIVYKSKHDQNDRKTEQLVTCTNTRRYKDS